MTEEPDPPLHQAIRNRKLAVARKLIGHCDLETRGRFDMTALMIACSEAGKTGSAVALALIAAGADVNALRVSDGMTPLKFAAKACPPEVLVALLDHGAVVDGPPATDQTALMLAARENHVPALDVLIRYGADIDRPCTLGWAHGRNAEGLAELEKRKNALTFLKGVRAARAQR